MSKFQIVECIFRLSSGSSIGFYKIFFLSVVAFLCIHSLEITILTVRIIWICFNSFGWVHIFHCCSLNVSLQLLILGRTSFASEVILYVFLDKQISVNIPLILKSWSLYVILIYYFNLTILWTVRLWRF